MHNAKCSKLIKNLYIHIKCIDITSHEILGQVLNDVNDTNENKYPCINFESTVTLMLFLIRRSSISIKINLYRNELSEK